MAKPPAVITSGGAPASDDQNLIAAGPRGPLLMQDFNLPKKLAHRNRERIPERTKGWGADGILIATDDIPEITSVPCEPTQRKSQNTIGEKYGRKD